ncbi:MAG: TIGR01777 family oxidoreductase [Acidipropionibacterium jensenii]|uniref:TIGR01777 family oxidoreductase n=1 Tax=Acidipropionibacterium jensenii TaxID=1749 RepID=UPI002647AEC1|nr:TIGR01777 family oxidoreductase [Acidipropionibacterium jensenii]MDN6513180.1 TIGR01777 family oxidoreductase [Acidipropionibacterium jensenii]
MRIAIGGFAGLLGSALVTELRRQGHEVVTLTRHEPIEASDRRWDLDTLSIAPPFLDDVDAVINLAGEPIAGGRWTEDRKQRILYSRLDTTRIVTRALESSKRCKIFLNGSAVGYYGPRGDEWVCEQDGAGDGFLAGVCRQWEAAASEAPDDVRVVMLRTGQVIASQGGFLAKQRPMVRLGLAGRMGSGRQYLSWISLRDHIRVMIAALTNPEIVGPINLVAPIPVTNAEFIATYSEYLHRPHMLPLPTPAVRMIFGSELGDEALLAGQRVRGEVLGRIGFEFDDPSLARAIATAERGRR